MNSDLLEEIRNELPEGQFTLDWLITRLGEQSFGLIILILAVLAIAPPLAIPGGLLLLVPAVQMIAGRSSVRFPTWVAARQLPSKPLQLVLQRVIPGVKIAEKIVHQRPPSLGIITKRVLGITVVLLSIRLVTHPIPLSNILPAILTALIALAYLQEDGLLLCLGLIAGMVLLVADAVILFKLAQQIREADFGQVTVLHRGSMESIVHQLV